MTTTAPPLSPQSLQEQKSLKFAKQGIVMGILSGVFFSLAGVFIEYGKGMAPFSNPSFAFLIPFLCAGIHDLTAATLTTCFNIAQGRLPELGRSIVSRPGRPVIMGALIGAICGMGGYMAALHLMGAAYAMPISSAYPAVGAVLAVFFLKEQIRPVAWAGIVLCVGGAIIIGYTPPESSVGAFFYLGLICAVVAAFGWAIEGVCATSGMDFIDPLVALNMYYLVSMSLFWGIIIPITGSMVLPEAGGWSAFGALLCSKGALFVMCGGVFGFLAFVCWYKAICMTGLSRAMALNVSYALWGILFSSFINDTPITTTLLLGAAIIFVGMVLVIGNPKNMLNLRSME